LQIQAILKLWCNTNTAGALLAVGVALIEGPIYLPMSNFWFGLLVGLVYLLLINLMNIWLRPRILGRRSNCTRGWCSSLFSPQWSFWGCLAR